jgi:hypothetical protein
MRAAVRFEDLARHRRDRLGVGQIDGEGARLPADATDLRSNRVQTVDPAREQEDLAAAPSQLARRRLADASRCPGYYRKGSGENHCRRSFATMPTRDTVAPAAVYPLT